MMQDESSKDQANGSRDEAQGRRTFIKAAGLSLGGAVLGAGRVSASDLIGAGWQDKDNRIVRENRKSGTRAWDPSHAGSTHRIEGYSLQDSVAPGDTLQFCVSSANADYTINIYRIGWYGGKGGHKVTSLLGENGEKQPIPEPVGDHDLIKCDWPVTDTVSVKENWTTGLYYALFKSGEEASAYPFVVRETKPTAKMLVQLPFNTLQAYNGWGGRSFYSFKSDDDEYHDAVSYKRPYDSPYALHLGYAIHFLRWAEREGYSMAYASSLDMMRYPQSLQDYNLAVCVGHDEYPHVKQYDAYKNGRDTGTNLMFIGGNLWTTKTRYRKSDHTIYRNDDWPNWQEAKITGLEFGPGTSLWKLADLSVEDTSHRWFDDTGFEEGEEVVGVVGHEWDQVAPASPDNLEVLFHYEKGTQKDPISVDADADSIVYEADSGATVFNCGVLGWPYRLDPDSTWGQNEWPLNHMEDYKPEVLEPDPKLQAFQKNVTDDLIKGT